MSVYDAVLAALDAKLEAEAALVGTEYELDPVLACALEFARATVAHREAYLEHGRWRERRAADDTQEAAWLALRDAVVATLGPAEQETNDD